MSLMLSIPYPEFPELNLARPSKDRRVASALAGRSSLCHKTVNATLPPFASLSAQRSPVRGNALPDPKVPKGTTPDCDAKIDWVVRERHGTDGGRDAPMTFTAAASPAQAEATKTGQHANQDAGCAVMTTADGQ
jgi:hypothetical protein